MTADDSSIETIQEDKVGVKRPRLYTVIMHNDDYTTMEFVVAMLEQVFKKTPVEATQIMLQVHHKGFGRCGIYPLDLAEAKVMLVHKKAKESGYPLRCSIEEA